MTFEWDAISRPGPRSENQDAVGARVLSPSEMALCIADGVGGSLGGAMAAKMSVEIFLESVAAAADQDLTQLLLNMDAAVRSAAADDSNLRGMATTFSGCILREWSLRGIHAGDSRVFLLRGNGLKQLTVDQTEVNRLFRAGKLTDREARAYFRSNVLESALGGQSPVQPLEFTFDVERGDRLVLTTDGIHSVLEKVAIRDLSLASRTPGEFCSRVVREVEDRRPTDNYTVLTAFIR